MLQEFEDWAGWSVILEDVKDYLFPPVMLVLLEDERCQFSRRGLRRLLGRKNRKALENALRNLPKDTRIDELMQWLWHTDTIFVHVALDAIERAIEAVDSLGDNAPRPPTALEVLYICVSEAYKLDT
jgi:hypothetical protein